MSTSEAFTCVGLIADILGAALIWRYGLPEPVTRGGHIRLIAQQTDTKEAAEAERYDLINGLGLGLLIGGFLLQFVAQLVAIWSR